MNQPSTVGDKLQVGSIAEVEGKNWSAYDENIARKAVGEAKDTVAVGAGICVSETYRVVVAKGKC